MSINNIIIGCAICLTVTNCSSKLSPKHSEMNEIEIEKAANLYHQMSDYFLQPSELYRIYKDSALLVSPNNVDLRQRLSYSYKKVGEHIKAMETLNKAVEIDTANGKADVLMYRAWTLLYYYHDYEGAIRDVNLIEQITGNEYNNCWGEPCGFHKGQALYKLKKYEKAIEIFNLVNTYESKLGFDITENHLIFFYLGRCFFELREYDKAIEYYKKALISVEKFPEAYYQIGLANKQLKNFKLAQNNFKLALKYIKYSMDEPYVERFDEVFPHMIEKEIDSLYNRL